MFKCKECGFESLEVISIAICDVENKYIFKAGEMKFVEMESCELNEHRGWACVSCGECFDDDIQDEIDNIGGDF